MYVKPFEYLRSGSLEAASSALAEHGPGARVIAGGQSLMPMLNLGLFEVDVLVDIGGVPGLDAVGSGPDSIEIGALVTHRMIEQVTYHWIKERSEGSRIDLVVKNVSFGDLLVLRRALGTEISGVKQVTQRSFKQGVALIELKARGTTEEVAESLYTTEFAKFSLEVEDISGKKLTGSLVKK